MGGLAGNSRAALTPTLQSCIIAVIAEPIIINASNNPIIVLCNLLLSFFTRPFLAISSCIFTLAPY